MYYLLLGALAHDCPTMCEIGMGQNPQRFPEEEEPLFPKLFQVSQLCC